MNSLICFLLLAFALPSTASEWKTVAEKGFVLKYRFVDGDIEVEMRSPRRGWVAVGFNPKPGLTGTHLVMGAVRGEAVELSERKVLRPGEYPEVEALGGEKVVELKWGKENANGTVISFRMPAAYGDDFRHSLSPGSSIHLTLAYSMEDDFLHHSIMRTSIHTTL